MYITCMHTAVLAPSTRLVQDTRILVSSSNNSILALHFSMHALESVVGVVLDDSS